MERFQTDTSQCISPLSPNIMGESVARSRPKHPPGLLALYCPHVLRNLGQSVPVKMQWELFSPCMATDTKLSKTVPFQDDWGSEHKACRAPDCPDTAFAIRFDDLPFYAETIRGLKNGEWQIFKLFYIEKITSQRKIANRLGLSSTGTVRNTLKRIDEKLARLHADLTLIKVRFPDDQEDGNCIPTADYLSLHQLSRSHSVTKKKQSVCRASAPWCPERRTS